MAVRRAPAPPEGGQDFPKLTDHLGRVLILEPTEETTIETNRGESEITRAVAMVYNEATKKVEDLGDVTVFWKRLRAQLHDAIAAQDTIVGRLMMTGRAYVLQDVDDATLKTIEKQML